MSFPVAACDASPPPSQGRRHINGVVSNGVVPKSQICKLGAKAALLIRPGLIRPGLCCSNKVADLWPRLLHDVRRSQAALHVPGAWGLDILHRTHGSFLIRRQRGHPGVVLPLVISKFGESLGRNAIRFEPN